MDKKIYSKSVIAALVLVMSSVAFADDDDTIYGWEIMSKQERIEHREKMRSLKTEQERELYRKAHHEEMKKRAEKMGIELPDEPLPRGSGMKRKDDRDKKGMGDGPHRM